MGPCIVKAGGQADMGRVGRRDMNIHPRARQVDFQRAIERKLKGAAFVFTRAGGAAVCL